MAFTTLKISDVDTAITTIDATTTAEVIDTLQPPI